MSDGDNQMRVESSWTTLAFSLQTKWSSLTQVEHFDGRDGSASLQQSHQVGMAQIGSF